MHKKEKRTKRKSKNDDSVLFGTVTVGTKGQFVIPVDARKKLSIKPGDHLLIFGNKENKVLAVIKSDEIAELLGDIASLKELKIGKE